LGLYRDEQGMALIGVIMAVLIFSSLCGALLFMAEKDNLMANDEEAALKALYAADSGIRAVLMEMQDNPAITYQNVMAICKNLTERKIPVGGAVIDTIKPEYAGDMVKISATGICGRAKKELIAYISMPSESKLRPLLNGFTVGSLPGLTVSSNGIMRGNIFSCGDVCLGESAAVFGDIYALGDVEIGSEAQVEGNVTARGTITCGENASVKGEIQPFCGFIPEVPVFPELDRRYFFEQAVGQEGHYYGKDKTSKHFFGNDLVNMFGVYYVEGDVVIASGGTEYSGNAAIFAEGRIVVHDDMLPIDAGSSLALISAGDLELNGTFHGVIIAGGELKGELRIMGIAAANSIGDCSLNEFTYCEDVVNGLEKYLALDGTPAKLEIWRELYDIY
jgi:cytoskeletal protein CcmA (bactofilin family)